MYWVERGWTRRFELGPAGGGRGGKVGKWKNNKNVGWGEMGGEKGEDGIGTREFGVGI